MCERPKTTQERTAPKETRQTRTRKAKRNARFIVNGGEPRTNTGIYTDAKRRPRGTPDTLLQARLIPEARPVHYYTDGGWRSRFTGDTNTRECLCTVVLLTVQRFTVCVIHPALCDADVLAF